MSPRERGRRRIAMLFWRVFNPVARRLAGIAPFWVVLETKGRRSARPRQVPLAAGPWEGDTTWLICVHGEHASFARNIAADSQVRLKVRRRWRTGTATLIPMDERILARFSAYARSGPKKLGIDPRLVRVELDA